MKRYIIERLLQLIPILFGISFLSFALMHLAGGDAVSTMLENQGVAVTQELIDARRHELGLDQPFFVQYLHWLGGVLSGNMGTSYVSGNDVFGAFASKLPATMLLTLSSVLVTVLVAVPLGILSATHHNRALDYALRILSFIGNSLPNFFIALLLVLVFAIWLGWLPAISSTVGTNGLPAISLRGLVLPTATLSFAMVAKYTRLIRAMVLEELAKPYVVGARARGLSSWAILRTNVLKNVMIMLVTMLALSIGDLLGGTAIVEIIFMWDGVGKLALDAITMRDYPTIQAYVLWMAIIYVLVNLGADLLYRALDPRVRLGDAA